MCTIPVAAYLGTDTQMTTSRHRLAMTFPPNLATTDDAIIRCIAYIATTMGCYYRVKDMTFPQNLATTDEAIIRCIAYIATTMAICYCHVKDIEVHPPQEGFTLVENSLHMIGMPDPDKTISPTTDRLRILIADHELCRSTAAFLHVALTITDSMTCVLAATATG